MPANRHNPPRDAASTGELRVAVVGAGFLGCALARALHAQGTACVLFSRTGRPRGDIPKSVQACAFDLTAPDPAPPAFEGCNTLVVAIAPGTDQDRRAVYVEGTRAAVERTKPWAQVLYVGSTSAFADHDGWVHEGRTAVPESERGQVQRDAEAVIHTACAAARTRCVILRLGGLYGPGRDLGRVYRRRSDSPLSGDGNNPTNLVHLDDAVQAVTAALAHPDVTGIVSVCDDDHRPRRLLYDDFAAAVGQDAARWELPRASGPPVGKRVSNQRMKSALGVQLLHPEHRAP